MKQLTSGGNLSTEQMAPIQNLRALRFRKILAYIEVLLCTLLILQK